MPSNCESQAEKKAEGNGEKKPKAEHGGGENDATHEKPAKKPPAKGEHTEGKKAEEPKASAKEEKKSH